MAPTHRHAFGSVIHPNPHPRKLLRASVFNPRQMPQINRDTFKAQHETIGS
jgi:hypothetical protein